MSYNKTEYLKAWRERNPDRVREYCKRRQLHPNFKPNRRRSYFRNKYGLTEQEMEAMHRSQNGRCLICDAEKGLENKRGQGLMVDHCHETGVVRGLLCNRCNIHLGWYEQHRKGIEDYLERGSGNELGEGA